MRTAPSERRSTIDTAVAASTTAYLRAESSASSRGSDGAVSFVAQHGLQKADLQRLADIEYTETIFPPATARIAEAAGELTEAERIGVALKIASTEARAGCEVGEVEVDSGKVRIRT